MSTYFSNAGIGLYNSLCPAPQVTRWDNGKIVEEKTSIVSRVCYVVSNVPFIAGNLLKGLLAWPIFFAGPTASKIASRFYIKRQVALYNKPQARICKVLTWTAERLQLEWNQGWANRKKGDPQGTCLGTMDVTLGRKKEVAGYKFTPASSYRKRQIKKGRFVPDHPSRGKGDVKEGIAISLFQSSGLGTKYCPTKDRNGNPLKGRCDWILKPENHKTKTDGYIQRNKNMGTMEVPIEGSNGNNHENFIDILGHPDKYIKMLKAMGHNTFRFSLERSVIQPEKPNEDGTNSYDKEALFLYDRLIDRLIKAGIEPDITLCHFVHPKWFTESGGMENSKNVDGFVRYGNDMIERYKAKVKKIKVFNEIGVDVAQKYIRGVYPPRLISQVNKAALVAMNMLIVNAKIYKNVYDRAENGEKDYENIVISSSLQWLKFKTIRGNIIEKITAYFFTNVFHTFVYNFFLTGVFSFKIPFLVNRQFIVPKEEFAKYHRFLGEVAVQFYGFANIEVGGNAGKRRPGREGPEGAISNFIFLKDRFGITSGSTCREGEGSAAMSFGPAFERGSLREQYREVLFEATELCKPVDVEASKNKENWKEIAITETGRDACVQTFDRSADFRKNPLSKVIGDQLQLEGYQEIEDVLRNNAIQWGYSRKKVKKYEGKSSSSSKATRILKQRKTASVHGSEA